MVTRQGGQRCRTLAGESVAVIYPGRAAEGCRIWNADGSTDIWRSYDLLWEQKERYTVGPNWAQCCDSGHTLPRQNSATILELSILGQAIQHYSCFISYSSKDAEFVHQLHGPALAGQGCAVLVRPA